MTSIRIRPRFQQRITRSPESLMQLFEQQLIACENGCVGSIIPENHVLIQINSSERHFWSPQLWLTFDSESDGSTLMRGLYGPSPSVWTLFIFGYGALGVAALFITLAGLSQLNLDMSAPILWALPIIFSLALGIYITAQMGQKLGAQQTFELHQFLETTLDEKISIH
ncbi:hypothetical protein Fleli_2865 [Bernardetia litoralis DSM 6794]|uniref:Uncharacterized protein n=1 Tax=Bernardetia litoralis (strain ATCC 23117 / DSM 6794 / NBRC 15988 / NCIMB 1366 / Fx l1 / Sio-4) TaxID=880071 RepID=I4AMN3_BERLS|nr:hypothetical protein [Bernardetia litoralis]AFM05218.1 hypothetical protein Fleli_2865 [Bernardetia litoralis DSM 6794]